MNDVPAAGNGVAPPPPDAAPRRLLVVGTGLIGTSAALALRRAAPQVQVLLEDADPEAVRAAVARGAGEPHDGAPVDHVLVAVPPTVAAQLATTHGAASGAQITQTFSDVSSVQAHVQREVETAGRADVWCGTHPMAGRERGGAAAADRDLFRGRTWVLCPSARTAPLARARAEWIARSCGARVVVRTAEEHDAAVARVSHVPQLVASALAAALADAPAERTALAGPGLLDTTRIAGSPPDLWADLVPANAAEVVPALDAVLERLSAVRRAADDGPDALRGAVRALVAEGNEGRARLPGKRGQQPDAYRWVPVVVQDRPGQLAGLFADAAAGGVNVEDVRVDHTPGLPEGVVELAVAPSQTALCVEHLSGAGWHVAPARGAAAG